MLAFRAPNQERAVSSAGWGKVLAPRSVLFTDTGSSSGGRGSGCSTSSDRHFRTSARQRMAPEDKDRTISTAESGVTSNTANLCTKILDFRGFDSSRILIVRGGIPRPIGNFPEILSQRILVGRFLDLACASAAAEYNRLRHACSGFVALPWKCS